MMITGRQHWEEQGPEPQFPDSLHIYFSEHWISSNGLLSDVTWMYKKASLQWGQGGNDRHYQDTLYHNIIQQMKPFSAGRDW